MNIVPKPWNAIETSYSGDALIVQVSQRTYTFQQSVFPTSIVACGQELLASPIRIVGMENGQDINWHANELLLMRKDPDCIEMVATQESYLMILNAFIKITYDGYIEYILKLAPRGNFNNDSGTLELAERFFERLWIEIPFKKSAIQLSHNSRWASHSRSGKALETSFKFTPVNWYGNDQCGLSIYAGSSENWSGQNTDTAMETFVSDETYCFRMRLIDNISNHNNDLGQGKNPSSKEDAYKGMVNRLEYGTNQPVIVYDMALQATPVKPYDAQGIRNHIFHMSTWLMKGRNYVDFLLGPVSDEDPTVMLDYLKDKGVNVITLHELWSETEGYWRASIHREAQIKETIKEIHKRGMKAILYFCNSISTMREVDASYMKQNCQMLANEKPNMTYYRPNRHTQRVVRACLCGPKIGEEFLNGIKECVTRMDADGIYLDSSNIPWDCRNELHGCGYRDADGQLCETFPVHKHHSYYQKLYEEIHDKMGKLVHLHSYSSIMPSTLGFSDAFWCAEPIAFDIISGLVEPDDIEMDYFQVEGYGRNLGVFSEYLIYETGDGRWDFQKGLSFAVVNGFFPRLNAMGKAVDWMEQIWKALDEYDTTDSSFVGYWNEDRAVAADHDKVYLSYYEKNTGKLVIVSNPHSYKAEQVTISLQCGQFKKDLLSGARISGQNITLDFEPYSYRMLLVEDLSGTADR